MKDSDMSDNTHLRADDFSMCQTCGVALTASELQQFKSKPRGRAVVSNDALVLDLGLDTNVKHRNMGGGRPSKAGSSVDQHTSDAMYLSVGKA